MNEIWGLVSRAITTLISWFRVFYWVGHDWVTSLHYWGYIGQSLCGKQTLKCLGKMVHEVGKLLSLGSGRNFLYCVCILVQVAIIRYHRLGRLINGNPFLTVLEAGSPGPGCQHCQVLGEPCFPVGRWLDPHVTESRKRKQVHMSLLIRALIPFMKATPSWPNFPKSPTPWLPSHWGVRISTAEFGGTQTFSPEHLPTVL